jgi:3-hydroxymyristoyl/3-hydroxydecanoyl-(acyl carrier protein) dehydratase
MKTEIDGHLKNFIAASNEASAEILFPVSFTGFRGHFPGQPILPGVCQISIAMAMAERLSRKRLALVEVVNAKFVSIVRPDQLLQVQCRLAGDMLTANLSSDATRIAELKLRIKDAQE